MEAAYRKPAASAVGNTYHSKSALEKLRTVALTLCAASLRPMSGCMPPQAALRLHAVNYTQPLQGCITTCFLLVHPARISIAFGLEIMMRGVTLVEGVIDNPMAVCHLGNHSHLVRDKYNRGTPRNVLHNLINLFDEIMIDI